MVQTHILVALSSGQLFHCSSPNHPRHSHEGWTEFLFCCCVKAPNYLITPCNTAINNKNGCTKGVIILFIGLGLLPESGQHSPHAYISVLYSALLCFAETLLHRKLKSMFSLVQSTHQESRGAVQEASDSGNEASVEKAGELRRDSPGLWRMEQAAHNEVFTWDVKVKDGGELFSSPMHFFL